MVQIWGGAPSTEPLPFGIQSSQAASISSIDVDSEVPHDLSSSDRESEETLARPDQEQREEQDDQGEDYLDLLGGGPVGEPIEQPNVSKRKRPSCKAKFLV